MKCWNGAIEATAKMEDKEVIKVLVRCLVGCLVMSWGYLRHLRGGRGAMWVGVEDSLRDDDEVWCVLLLDMDFDGACGGERDFFLGCEGSYDVGITVAFRVCNKPFKPLGGPSGRLKSREGFHGTNWPLQIKQLAVHSAQPVVEDVHLLMAINVVSWAFIKHVVVPFPGLVQCFISFLLEVTYFFKLLSGLGWWTVPLDKGLFKEILGINGS
uniref:Uncharacterized protein n=1 Tax=Tanacetum cinerariifolium TaxID=118510 RepID=A0A6L2NLG7_TANCI|nr:hypothetical protein [Tanacetum cinerariifolium]